MTRFQPVRRRNGVIASEISRNRKAQMPVVSSSSSTGLAPSRSCSVRHASHAAGTSARRKIARLLQAGEHQQGNASVILAEIHAGVQRRHLIAVAVEHHRRPRQQIRQAPLPRLAPARMIDLAGSRSSRTRTPCGFAVCHAVRGCLSTKRIRTIDLMLLKPYFHGTTRRSGAPFWFVSVLPYKPTARIVSGCIASSSRSPST